jgi:hypothetical protein
VRGGKGSILTEAWLTKPSNWVRSRRSAFTHGQGCGLWARRRESGAYRCRLCRTFVRRPRRTLCRSLAPVVACYSTCESIYSDGQCVVSAHAKSNPARSQCRGEACEFLAHGLAIVAENVVILDIFFNFCGVVCTYCGLSRGTGPTTTQITGPGSALRGKCTHKRHIVCSIFPTARGQRQRRLTPSLLVGFEQLHKAGRNVW